MKLVEIVSSDVDQQRIAALKRTSTIARPEQSRPKPEHTVGDLIVDSVRDCSV